MKKMALLAIALSVSGPIAIKAEDAQKLYEANCSECHGDDGKGKTRMGEKLSLKTDFTDPKVQDSLKSDDIVKAIKEGVIDKETKKKKMKPIDDLNDGDIKILVAYVRTFKK